MLLALGQILFRPLARILVALSKATLTRFDRLDFHIELLLWIHVTCRQLGHNDNLGIESRFYCQK